MVCVEPGRRLAAIAREILRPFPHAVVEQSTFEAWDSAGRRFSLLFSAQAYHWIDPAVAISKPREILDLDGTVALVWNVPRRDPSPIRTALNRAYECHAPQLAEKSGNFAGKSRAAIVGVFANSRGYTSIGEEKFPFVREYATTEYIQLLGTFSDHLALRPDVRTILFQAVEAAIREDGGSIAVTYDAICYLFKTIREA
jgi:hypothetical protein